MTSLWIAIGFAGQAMFSMRFLVQWLSSERAGRSIIPIAFWYFSLAGGCILLAYAIWRRDPVFIVGQAAGLFIYTRNLYFIHRERWRGGLAAADEPETGLPRSPGARARHKRRGAATALAMIANSQRTAPLRGGVRVTPGVAYGAPGMAMTLAVLTGLRLLFLAASPYPLDPEEAQYWSYGEAPAFGYFSKPPLLPWLIAATTAIGGDTAFGVRLAAPLMHAAAAFLVYLIGRRLFEARIGFFAGLIYATLPGVSFSAGLMTTDLPLLLAWAAAVYAFVRALETGDRRWWLGVGTALGVGLLGKYTMIALVPSALLFLLLSPADRSVLKSTGPPLALAAAFLILLPNLAWNASHGFATIAHVGDNASLGGDLVHPDRLLAFLGAQFGIFNPVFFSVLLVLLGSWASVGRDRRYRLLLAFSAPILLVITLESLLSRAHANWAAAAYVTAAIAVPAWLFGTGRTRWLGAGLGINLAFAAAWMLYVLTLGPMAPDLPARLDPLAKLRGADGLGPPLKEALARDPGARLLVDDRRLMALCLFYAGVPLGDAVEWNPDGVADNHYELATTLEPAPAGGYVFISRKPDVAHVTRHFADVEELAPIVIRTHADRELRLRLFRLAGFEGYGRRETPR